MLVVASPPIEQCITLVKKKPCIQPGYPKDKKARRAWPVTGTVRTPCNPDTMQISDVWQPKQPALPP